VLWLGDAPERMQILHELREAMTPGQRSRLNSPITARQRVEAILLARHSGSEETEGLAGRTAEGAIAGARSRDRAAHE
jgi:hypothetical protein